MAHCRHSCAIITAAGIGRRLGEDKALVDLGGESAIERLVGTCLAAAVDQIVVVRRPGSGVLPAKVLERVDLVEVQSEEMLQSVQAGLAAVEARVDGLLLLPIDHALVESSTVALVLAHLHTDRPEIVLPLHDDRPGHPVAFSRPIGAEIQARQTGSVRDVIRADAQRVHVVRVSDPWTRRDIDTPADLAEARSSFDARRSLAPSKVTDDLMRRHRSRRAFTGQPVEPELIEQIVDTARYASTSSMLQAYSVVAVGDSLQKEKVAELCGGQAHIRQAPWFLAICADLHKIELACTKHGRRVRSDSLELFLQATVDAALVGQNLLLLAESHGLGGCFIGAARNHPKAMADTLNLPPRVFVVFGLVLGHAIDDPIPRGRMPISGVCHGGQYDRAGAAAAIDQADEQARAWAQVTNRERGGYMGRRVDESKAWSDRVATAWGLQDPAVARSGESDPARRNAISARTSLFAELRILGFGLEPGCV